MRLHTPTSDERIGRFVNVNDAVSVLIAAPIAFLLRDPDFSTEGYLGAAEIYCATSFAVGIVMLFVFHVGKNLSDYVSMRDLFTIIKVSLATVAATFFILFVATRLYLVGRSIPALHFLVLISLMFLGRAIATRRRERKERRGAGPMANPKHVLIIGANRLTWFYLRMIDSFDMGRTHIVAILDANPKVLGRSLYGRPVLAPPAELSRVITEYGVHGVRIERVVIAANRGRADAHAWTEVEDFCVSRSIDVDFLGDILNLNLDPPEMNPDADEITVPSKPYFAVKRVLDFAIALAALLILTPILAPVALGVLFDVGWPPVFWQKRDGLRGNPFLVYKFRTLRAPFDRQGQFVPENERISAFGDMLRRTRLDELPQLWNVLAGDMSFIGPRPLLPIDQPENFALRLSVRPGLTGWAQIHGGKLITAEVKGALDDWYVANASPRLDLQILLRTLKIVFTGDQLTGLPQPASDAEDAPAPSQPVADRS